MTPRMKDELKRLMSEINDEMGAGTVAFTSDPIISDTQVFPTGSHRLDRILEIGGYPVGRQIEILGKNSVGKTHLAMMAMVEIQKQNGITAYIDMEHSFDRRRAANLGLNIDKSIIAKPDWLELGLDITVKLIPQCSLIVFDSVGGASTEKEFIGDASSNDIGERAKRLTRTAPKIGALCARHNCSLIWINQVRESIDPFPVAMHDKTPGGNNFKHQQSIRLFLKRGKLITSKGETIGHFIKAKVVKNKMGTPHREAEIPFLFKYGVMPEWELVEMGVESKMIEKRGNYFYFKGENMGQGPLNAALYIKNNSELNEQLKKNIHAPSEGIPT